MNNPSPSILSVLIADSPDALERLQGCLRRRSPSAFSIGYATGKENGVVHATIALQGSPNEVEGCRRQIDKLIDVIEAKRLESALCLQVAIVRLGPQTPDPARAIRTLETVGAQVVRRDADGVVAQICAAPEIVESSLALLSELPALSVVRSSPIAMP